MVMRRGLFIGFLVLAVLVVTVILTQREIPLPDAQLAGNLVDATVGTAEQTVNTLGGVIERLMTTPQSALMRAILIVGGLVLLIIGWRMYDWIVPIAGIVVGATIALSLVPDNNTLLAVAAIVVGGLIGAALGYFLFYVAVFVIGAYIGIVLTGALLNMLSTTQPNEVVLLIGGVIGGLVLIGLSFQFLVVLAALTGAQMVALGLGLPALWMIVLAVASIILQFGLMRSYNYDFRRRRRRAVIVA